MMLVLTLVDAGLTILTIAPDWEWDNMRGCFVSMFIWVLWSTPPARASDCP